MIGKRGKVLLLNSTCVFLMSRYAFFNILKLKAFLDQGSVKSIYCTDKAFAIFVLEKLGVPVFIYAVASHA
ncbi:uncharacterized protein F4822DRAFT_314527 [Hypoxylon trugodes]|uniref:uncharacterized protein n=1 Tax=Hypoxylon trugodes TaxID=326681 RepID=UPI00219FC955|nr:uncharacterized protein F4822DRAFT_314527 [Hypoxylon trugodes]KAI1386387.1 hypothetical protein F4822DRAFT_314527 [Hypoxylon trugodes]